MWACLCCHWARNSSVVLSSREHRPCDPRQHIRHRDNQHFAWCPHLQRRQPCPHRDPVSFRSQHNSTGPMNQDLAQVAVTALADPIELRLAACRVLLGYQAHPRRALSSLAEGCAVADRSYDRSGHQRSDTRDLPQPDTGGMAGASPNTSWLQGRVALDEKGFILTGRDLPLVVDQDRVISGRFRAHISCWRSAYQEYSQWAMSAPEASSGLLQRLVRELFP
jgi:hypothetical protein